MRCMMKRIFLSVCLLAVAACTEPGEMTGVGAATGGIVGAGLGAIIGSQTGDAGSGIAIGAVAGAGAGAAVGNVLEAQDQAIRQQDEAIERQEQVIRAQRGEIDQLRQLGQDSVRFRSKPPGEKVTTLVNPHAGKVASTRFVPKTQQPAFAGRAAPAPLPRIEQPSTAAIIKEPKIEKPIVSEDMTGEAALIESNQVELSNNLIDTDPIDVVEQNQVEPAKLNQNEKPTSADCLSAEEEFQQANSKNETPDKLFHIRRALRLCPDDARYHKSLGDVYTSLGRAADAQFEYHEALKLSPDNAEIKEKISGEAKDLSEKY
jgi:uncharacterized protein YcfJ